MVAAGAARFILGVLRPVGWTGFLAGGFLVIWAVLWGATAWSYQCRSRDRHFGRREIGTWCAQWPGSQPN